MNKPIIIIGNGGHASVLVETLLQQQQKIIGYTAPKEEVNLFAVPYLGTDDVIEMYSPSDVELVLGIGSINVSTLRVRISKRFAEKGYSFASVIHSTAIVAPSVRLGQGVQIMAGAILQTNTSIADHTVINTGTIVDHDCVIGSRVHLAPGVTLSGSVTIGNGCHIGTGVTIIQGVTIGQETLVGAGAVVVRDIESSQIAYGIPAKIKK